MQWFRSWPTDDEVRARRVARPHVVDRLPRLLMHGFDYLNVAAWPTVPHGVCMLEWDVALDQKQRDRFGRLAKAQLGRVLVAPYHYGLTGYLPDVPEGAQEAATFGFGCIYFPNAVLREAVAEFTARRSVDPSARLTDTTFSAWHGDRFGSARVTWDVHPQHLREF